MTGIRIATALALVLLAPSCKEPVLEVRAGEFAGPYFITAKVQGFRGGHAICYQRSARDCVLRIGPGVEKIGADEDFISAAVRVAGGPDAFQYFFIVRDFDDPNFGFDGAGYNRNDCDRANCNRAVRGPFDDKEFRMQRRNHGVPEPVRFRASEYPTGL